MRTAREASERSIMSSLLDSRTTGILISRWAPDSDFSSGIHEGNSRSVADLAAQATKQVRRESLHRHDRGHPQSAQCRKPQSAA
jgi:hypothetical protein